MSNSDCVARDLESPADAAALQVHLAEQVELAEQYRIEAAELRTMFDAMQYRIDVLQQRLQAATESGREAGRQEPPSNAPAVDAASSAEVAALRAALAEAEAALASTRRARDQWIERLEASGKEKGELEHRLAATEAELTAARGTASRAAALADEVGSLRDRLHQAERREGDLAERLRAIEVERDRSASELAQAESRLGAALADCAAAEQQGQTLAAEHAALAQMAATLAGDIETTHQLTDDLWDGVRQDRVRIDRLAERFTAAIGDAVLAPAADRIAQLERELAAAQAGGESAATLAADRIEKLERELAAVQAGGESAATLAADRIEKLERELAAALARAAAADGLGALHEQLAELEAQRSALAEEVEIERARRREFEEAQATQALESAAELQERLTEMQAAFDEANSHHAEEMRAMRDEVGLHKSLLHDREVEMERLAAECAILQESVEEAITDLEVVGSETRSLDEELRLLDDETGIGGDLPGPCIAMPAEESLVDRGDPLSTALHTAESDELQAAVAIAAVPETADEAAPLHLMVIDEDPGFLAAVEQAAAMVPGVGARVCADPDMRVPPGAAVHLVVNLAAERFALDLMRGVSRWGLDEPEALVYCARNGRGVFFRSVMFLPPPCDIDECSTRLLAATGDALQRLLVVGEDVDFMSGLRESLGRIRASTAIAFDGRQAIDLMPMVKPQAVLVDLNLPRGDGLRVAAQVAANPDLRNVRIAMFWSRPLDPQLFRQQAIYAVRDFQMTPERLTRAVAPALGVLPTATTTIGAVPAVMRRGGPRPASANLLGN